MIEIVYKENTKDTGQGRKLNLPRNVRQIGEPETGRKIFIEDYVVTYLKKMAKEEAGSSRAAILLGDSERAEGIPYLFIRSAVAVEGAADFWEGVPFTDEVWAEIYETIKEYFAKQDILGWFLSVPGYPMDLDPGLLKTHVNYFGGVDKVLMVADPEAGEDDFFAYENGRLTRQKGYCIFYEQNEAMQRYMEDTGSGESNETREGFEDRAARSFRTLVQEKKDISGQKKVMTFLYTASTFLVMVVLVIGITLINNYEKMEGLEMTLSEISRSLDEQEELAAMDADSLTTAMEEENVRAQEPEGAEEASKPQEAEEGEETPKSQEPEEEQEPKPQEPEEEQESEPQENPEEETGAEEPEEAKAEEAPRQEEPEQPAETALSQNVIAIPDSYTVQEGDTLLKISRKIYGQDNRIDEICSLNEIHDMNHILVGQKLLLP